MLFRFDDWVTEQMKTRQNVRNILKHLNKRGTPPPKVWWVPPTGVRSVLRLALRYLILVLKANKTQKGEKRSFITALCYLHTQKLLDTLIEF